MLNVPDAEFDWVNARAKCSLVERFGVLKAQARADMLARNEILDESHDKDRFKFKDRAPKGFTIFDTWGSDRRAVDVDLTDERIEVTYGRVAARSPFSVTVTLNDEGVCKFRVGDDELATWQVLKRMLEGLFFDEEISK